MNKVLTNISPEMFIMYLRKSRQDDPNETIEEVLSKHETILQEFMEREYGFRIAEDNIYREVCSGESIEAREEIKKVLSKCESATTLAVVVVEPQRLSRGDLIDCGSLIQHLRYTKTLVVTPTMTYNLENKMERKFFQDELLRGNDYLEYIKEILARGKIASIKRGNFIGNTAPYGYDKVKIGKDHTLVPNDKADVVRMIFDWYVNGGLSQYEIAKKLDELNIPSCKGISWQRTGVSVMLKNIHYTGKVAFFVHRKTTAIVNGKKVTRYLLQDKDTVIIAEGKHPAIIDQETFEKAQQRKANNIPRKQTKYGLRNPYAGVLRCKVCGKVMMLQAYDNSEQRLYCKTSPVCCKSPTLSQITNAIVNALKTTELPKLEAQVKRNNKNEKEAKKSLLAQFHKQLAELNTQEQKQYDLLEKGIYTEEVFELRNTALKEKRTALKEQIQSMMEDIPEQVDYKEKVVQLKDVIKKLKDDSVPPAVKNKLLKSVVDRIEYYADKSQKVKQHNFTIEIFMNI